ncbi:MAG: metal ABC transporter ATP-binding protein [Thermodesulfobacteriota bacterium]
MKVLSVKDMNVEIGGLKVLDGITFDVEKGEVLAVIGPNGAGKTVLLKSLLGLLPHSGSIKWDPSIKKGYVPQRMDIETDVPLLVREFFSLRGGRTEEERIMEALKFVQLDPSILDSGFGEISVGQRQRVLVAWAVLGDPDVLLFDEPTADIDIRGQESVYSMISHLRAEMGLTVILVSHDLNVVYRHASSVICLNRKSICHGAPREILTPDQLQTLYGGDKAFFKHDHH